ncbi:hypothetical protein BV22DRAFT_1052164 [Leucogyrophana mollusca]|uniref:Uncharacterized protein n=1 Tax=Leucogyrophana mollusca TaxID=85980 RepID=A0ACB8AX46_9AGAM|nr:hypothetical protein BV22DRAFT_1052164 [Leucogyrophana mollusca]
MAVGGDLRNAKVDCDRYWSDHLGVPQSEDRIDVLRHIVDNAEYRIEELQAEVQGHTAQGQPSNPDGGRERQGVPPQDKSGWLLTSTEKGKSRAWEESPTKRTVPLVVMPPQPAKRATARGELLPYDETPPAGKASSGPWKVKGPFSTNMVGDWLIIREHGQKDAPDREYLFSGQEWDAAMASIRRGLPLLRTADHNAGHRVFDTSAAMQKFLSRTAKEKQVNEPPAWYREKHPATQTGASAHGSGPSTGQGTSGVPVRVCHFSGELPPTYARANAEAHRDMVIRAICLVLTVPGLYRDCMEQALLPITRLRANTPVSGDLNRGFTQKNAIRHMVLNGLTVQEANNAYVFADSWRYEALVHALRKGVAPPFSIILKPIRTPPCQQVSTENTSWNGWAKDMIVNSLVRCMALWTLLLTPCGCHGENHEAMLALEIVQAKREVFCAQKLLANCVVKEHETIATLHRFKAGKAVERTVRPAMMSSLVESSSAVYGCHAYYVFIVVITFDFAILFDFAREISVSGPQVNLNTVVYAGGI